MNKSRAASLSAAVLAAALAIAGVSTPGAGADPSPGSFAQQQ